ncbi:MAG: hypothetical protein H7263_08850 [Candidatus Sericytochromatia bacterium]|nr:hypothetical protein [Candidatus Sericytochromatia bacterium]
MEIKSIDKILDLPQQNPVTNKTKVTPAEKVVNPLQSTDHVESSKSVLATPFVKTQLSPIEGYEKAKSGLLNYFKNDFMNTPEFKNAVGNLTWNDVGAETVGFLSMHRDKATELSKYDNKAYFYGAEIYGMVAEIAVDKKTGAIKSVHVDPN